MGSEKLVRGSYWTLMGRQCVMPRGDQGSAFATAPSEGLPCLLDAKGKDAQPRSVDGRLPQRVSAQQGPQPVTVALSSAGPSSPCPYGPEANKLKVARDPNYAATFTLIAMFLPLSSR